MPVLHAAATIPLALKALKFIGRHFETEDFIPNFIKTIFMSKRVHRRAQRQASILAQKTWDFVPEGYEQSLGSEKYKFLQETTRMTNELYRQVCQYEKRRGFWGRLFDAMFSKKDYHEYKSKLRLLDLNLKNLKTNLLAYAVDLSSKSSNFIAPKQKKYCLKKPHKLRHEDVERTDDLVKHAEEMVLEREDHDYHAIFSETAYVDEMLSNPLREYFSGFLVFNAISKLDQSYDFTNETTNHNRKILLQAAMKKMQAVLVTGEKTSFSRSADYLYVFAHFQKNVLGCVNHLALENEFSTKSDLAILEIYRAALKMPTKEGQVIAFLNHIENSEFHPFHARLLMALTNNQNFTKEIQQRITAALRKHRMESDSRSLVHVREQQGLLGLRNLAAFEYTLALANAESFQDKPATRPVGSKALQGNPTALALLGTHYAFVANAKRHTPATALLEVGPTQSLRMLGQLVLRNMMLHFRNIAPISERMPWISPELMQTMTGILNSFRIEWQAAEGHRTTHLEVLSEESLRKHGPALDLAVGEACAKEMLIHSAQVHGSLDAIRTLNRVRFLALADIVAILRNFSKNPHDRAQMLQIISPATDLNEFFEHIESGADSNNPELIPHHLLDAFQVRIITEAARLKLGNVLDFFHIESRLRSANRHALQTEEADEIQEGELSPLSPWLRPKPSPRKSAPWEGPGYPETAAPQLQPHHAAPTPFVPFPRS